MLRLLGVRAHTDPGVTEEEIRALVEQGAESGVVQPAEHQLVERVFRLGDRQVAALMTPRPDVDWLDLDESPGAMHDELAEGRRSLLLVCRGDVDHVVGFVHAEDLLARAVRGEAIDAAALEALAQPPLFVPETAPAFRLLEQFRQQRAHAAVALDEYGGVAGVITLDDVLQELVGDIPDGAGADEGALIVARGDGSWLVDGQTPIADVEALLDVALTDGDGPAGRPGAARAGASSGPGYQTLGGFVMARLGHLPRVAEQFTWAGHRFEVVDMDARRVDRVLVARVRSDAATDATAAATA